MMRNRAATDALTHRGPDAGRFFNDYFVALGHRRLSILDPSPAANQPMTDASERYQLVFNGEIYNFRQLRDSLVQRGVSFRTTSDTEVLLQLLIQEGEEALQKLNGFFSFCFYDTQEETILLARDRFGIKPLFYYADDDKFLFASEINALLQYNIPRELNHEALFLYLQFHYTPDDLTMLKGVHKLLPGHLLRVRKKSVETHRYYQLPEADSGDLLSDYEAAKTELLTLMETAVQDRLVSDVPLGAFLSGGIDSSVVVALASRHTDRLQTFSIGYRDTPALDETRYAKAVAKAFGTEHTVFSLSDEDILEAVTGLLDFFGEPFADSSAIPTFILSQRTRQNVTVALSGDGGDELFAGYERYRGEFLVRQGGWLADLVAKNRDLLAKLPHSRSSFWGNKFRKLHRFAEAMHRSPKERYWFLSTFVQAEQVRELLSEKSREALDADYYERFRTHFLRHIEGNDITETLRGDVENMLPNDMLHKVDSMSMANSLEVRVPFLDHRVAEFAFRLPESFKINTKIKKRIVQDAFRSLLPAELYNRPKQGFDVPLRKGFQTSLRPLLDELLAPEFVDEQGIFNPDYVRRLREAVRTGGAYEQNHVWALLVFQHWYKHILTNLEV